VARISISSHGKVGKCLHCYQIRCPKSNLPPPWRYGFSDGDPSEAPESNYTSKYSGKNDRDRLPALGSVQTEARNFPQGKFWCPNFSIFGSGSLVRLRQTFGILLTAIRFELNFENVRVSGDEREVCTTCDMGYARDVIHFLCILNGIIPQRIPDMS